MNTTTILTVLAILVGTTVSTSGFAVINTVVAQLADNTTMTGNMTGGNATEGNTTGSISSIWTMDDDGDDDTRLPGGP